MSWWDIIPAVLEIGSIAVDYMGAEEATKGVEEGSAEQIRIETIKRNYATKVFEDNLERQKPFYDAGIKAGIQYPNAITNRMDPTKSGTYKTQLGLISKDLEGAPEYVKEEALQRLGAIEGEKQKNRLLDMQRIGLGAAGSAGTSGLNLGNTLAQSFNLSSGVLGSSQQEVSDRNQSAWNVAASQLSGLPAYMEAGKTDPSTLSTRFPGGTVGR